MSQILNIAAYTGTTANLFMRHEENRLHTFAQWRTHIPVDPRELARDGFCNTGQRHLLQCPFGGCIIRVEDFAVGFCDYVTCFYCGGQLRNWEDKGGSLTNVAWLEHARWLPRCPFLMAEKGQQFIDMIQSIYPPK
ncbi:putative inhibitor of apoptosis, partial [Lingula anatina]|uniref:Inhibitor of apoptosis n=1 Tax=Lingula anatina TaxID=7574 RepID=A0A1S3JG15_LINAN